MRRSALVLCSLITALLGLAPSAAAHEVGHAPPDRIGDMRSVLTESVLPEGVTGGLYENGRTVWLRSSTPDEVIVLDDAGQPRYRLFLGTAFHNAALPDAETPEGDISSAHGTGHQHDAASVPAGGPDWQPVGSELRWHSHAAHWGDPRLPSAVAADPSAEHLVRTWEISVHRPDSPQRTFALRGEIRWIPGPSPWVWTTPALVLTILLAVAFPRGRDSRRTARVIAGALGVGLFASLTHVLAALWARQGGPDTPWTIFRHENLPHLICWSLTIAAAITLVRGRRDGPILALFAAAGLIVLTIPDLRVLWSSTAVTSVGILIDRLLVILALALPAATIPALIRRLTEGGAVARSDPPRLTSA